MKFDLIKFDLNDIRMVQLMALFFVVIVLIVDIILFSSLMGNIGQEKIKRDKNAAAVNYFKGLISKKDKLTTAQIFPQENIDDLLKGIQKIAHQNNVTVTIGGSLETDKLDDVKNFYALKDFSVDTSGSFKDLGVFLTALKEMPDAVLDIRGFKMFCDKADTSKIQASINFVVLATKDEED
jgi:Tfp pilus assembly protein PilO